MSVPVATANPPTITGAPGSYVLNYYWSGTNTPTNYTVILYQVIQGVTTVAKNGSSGTNPTTAVSSTYSNLVPLGSYYFTVVATNGTGSSALAQSSTVMFYNPYCGPQGVQGYQGPQGLQGTAGPTGLQGSTGLQGPGGFSPTGPTGPLFLGGPITSDLFVSGGTPSIGRSNAAFNNIFYYGSISNTVDATVNRIGGVTLGASGAINCGNITAPTTNTINSLGINAGTCTGVDFVATSDARVKTDIVTITNALDKVKALRGVYFTRNGQTDRSVGVIAQEVEPVLPEVVHTGSDDMKSVSYGNMVGLLIEAVKELAEKMKV
jgi:hypothetical protein